MRGSSRSWARFWSNPGREPFGAKFWQFGGFRAAIKTAFWDYWETVRFGPNPGREPFGAKFWQFGGFRAAIKTAFWDYWETARFRPNPYPGGFLKGRSRSWALPWHVLLCTLAAFGRLKSLSRRFLEGSKQKLGPSMARAALYLGCI